MNWRKERFLAASQIAVGRQTKVMGLNRSLQNQKENWWLWKVWQGSVIEVNGHQNVYRIRQQPRKATVSHHPISMEVMFQELPQGPKSENAGFLMVLGIKPMALSRLDKCNTHRAVFPALSFSYKMMSFHNTCHFEYFKSPSNAYSSVNPLGGTATLPCLRRWQSSTHS